MAALPWFSTDGGRCKCSRLREPQGSKFVPSQNKGLDIGASPLEARSGGATSRAQDNGLTDRQRASLHDRTIHMEVAEIGRGQATLERLLLPSWPGTYSLDPAISGDEGAIVSDRTCLEADVTAFRRGGNDSE